MHRFTNVLAALSLVAGLSACSGGWSGFVIPQETELKPWVAPEADDLVESEDEGQGEEYHEYEDYEDEEGDEAEGADEAAGGATTPSS